MFVVDKFEGGSGRGGGGCAWASWEGEGDISGEGSGRPFHLG